MATLDDIISTSNSRAESSLSQMDSYLGELLRIVGSENYVLPPENISFSNNTAQFNAQGLVPSLTFVTGLPKLSDRATVLAQTDALVSGLKNRADGADPQKFAFPVWTAAAVPEDFTQQPEALVLPDLPSFFQPDLPRAPVLDGVSFALPDAPTVTTAVELVEGALPDPSALQLPAFNLPSPGIDFSAPSSSFNYVEEIYASSLLTAVRGALEGDIYNGGYGIRDTDEQGLWERAKDREAAAYRDTAGEIGRVFAARGFPVPGLDMAALQVAAHDKMAGALGDVNRDVMLKRSELYLSARQFALQQGVSFEGVMLQVHGQKMERALNASRFAADFGLQLNQALREFFTLKLSLWRSVAEVQAVQVTNLVKGFGLKLSAFDAQTKRSEVRISAQQAGNEAARVLESIRQTQLEQAKAEMAFEETKLRYVTQATQTYLAIHQGNETAFNAYHAAVQAQVAKYEPVRLGLEIYKGRIDGARAKGEVEKDRFGAAVEQHRENMGRFNQTMQQYLTALAYALDRVKALAGEGNQDAIALQNLLVSQTAENNRFGLQGAEIRIREFQNRWSQYLEHVKAAQKSLLEKDAASISASQVAVHALESVLQGAQQMLLGIADKTA